MVLDHNDLERIERLVFKNGDDIAVSISRSFERLEERMDATESCLYSRMADVEDRIEGSRQAIADQLADLRNSVHEHEPAPVDELPWHN